jgi:competence protein ComEC
MRWIVDLIAISLAAQLGVWPLLAVHFQQLYLGTLLSNLIVLPWIIVILWTSVTLLLLSFIPVAAQWIGTLLSGFLETLSMTVTWLSSLPAMSITVIVPPAWSIVIYYVILTGLLLVAQQRWAQPSWSRALAKASVRS